MPAKLTLTRRRLFSPFHCCCCFYSRKLSLYALSRLCFANFHLFFANFWLNFQKSFSILRWRLPMTHQIDFPHPHWEIFDAGNVSWLTKVMRKSKFMLSLLSNSSLIAYHLVVQLASKGKGRHPGIISRNFQHFRCHRTATRAAAPHFEFERQFNASTTHHPIPDSSWFGFGTLSTSSFAIFFLL